MSLTAHAADILLEVLRGEGTFIQLHIGWPGANATGNPALERTRKSVRFGAPTDGVMRSGAATWTSVAASETYTHFSVWSRNGVALGSGELTRQAVFAGDDFTLDEVIWSLT